MLGGGLTKNGKKAMREVLKANLDVFAWKPTDKTGVPQTLTQHKLRVKEGTTPSRQKKRRMAPERSKVVNEENVGATYQRRVDRAFEKQIGRNLEVYVDDLVIKSHSEQEAIRDIEETFHTLRKINMKLNPKKCMFEAEKGIFHGHTISKDGIQACSEKAQSIINMSSSKTLKDVQSLNGILAKAERALGEMKRQMEGLPTLNAHVNGEKLIKYLSTPEEAVSVVLLAEQGDNKYRLFCRACIAIFEN
ncbi:reverse transcriptase domain-containing protein [Tanacetum coccineum]